METKTFEAFQGDYLKRAYTSCGYNKSLLSEVSGISRRTLTNLKHKYPFLFEKRSTGTNPERVNIRSFDEELREYIVFLHAKCGGRVTLITEILGVHHKTTRAFLNKFGLAIIKKESKPPKPKPLKQLIKEDKFSCMPKLTTEERDNWYNKDFF
jgi:hypothetical protein